MPNRSIRKVMIESQTMQQAVNDVADRIVQLYKSSTSERRILVAVAGTPGSGKSCFGYPLADRVNELLGQHVDHAKIDEEEGLAEPSAATVRGSRSLIAMCVGLDGWHHTRKELDAFPDPAEARRRRGAPFTFDAVSYSSFIQSLRASPPLPAISFPTFSHSKKDPVPSDFDILPQHRVVIIEGLYALLDTTPWSETAALMDERVWIDCPREVARDRLIRRHLKDGVEDTLEKAQDRVDKSDMLNGDFIREHLVQPTHVVKSIDDPRFVQSDLR